MKRPSDQVLTVAQMQAAEQALIDAGTSVDELMQRAGKGAAGYVWRMAAGRSVTVLCGPGNNGGDGYVIAEALRGRGLVVRVVAPIEPRTGAAKRACQSFRGEIATSPGGVSGGLFVDCLFGSGLSRIVGDDLLDLIDALHASHALAVAVDVPSGVMADDGLCGDRLHGFDCTLALGAWKYAHFSGPAAGLCGALRLVDIGIGERESAKARLVPPPRLRAPHAFEHKYRRGLVGIVGGAMPGAALLAARAAMRAGAGYVKLFAEKTHPATPAGLVVDDEPLGDALGDERIDTLLVGPGLGRDATARERLATVLKAHRRTVLDADALHLLDHRLLDLAMADKLLVTPHEGELRKLCGNFGLEYGSRRMAAAALYQETGLTVLAKGADTTVHGDDIEHGGETGLFPLGPGWLATAGTGDVLAGIVAGRLAADRSLFEAAAQGVWLHHEAARISGPAFTADELAAAIPAACARFL